MSVNDILSRFDGSSAGWCVIAFILLLSLIQISPLKLNPWDSILAWFGHKLNGKELTELRKQLTTMWVNQHRQTILVFARECRTGIAHSPDEWANTLTVADEYENYCKKNDIANGIVKADTMFIRNLYQDLSREQKIQ